MTKLKITIIAALCIAVTSIAQAGERDGFAIMWIGQIHEHTSPAAVDTLIAEVAETVTQNDGTLFFEISRVGNQLFGYERFANLNGMMAQFELVGPLYPRITKAWKPVTVVPTTEVPAEVSEMLKNYNALVPDSVANAGT